MATNANANGIPFLKRTGIPPAIKNSMVVYYDIKKQGATNESMKADPRLIDLSGHGYDAKLNNFAWTEDSGINTTTYPNALVFDGVDDYGLVEDLPLLVKEVGYTVIAKRKWINDDNNGCLVSKSPSVLNGAFIFEIKSYNECYSFGKSNPNLYLITEDITYQKSNYYNNTKINKGVGIDGNYVYIGAFREGDSRFANFALYSLMLFNRDLTTEEIEFVKQKYFSD